MNWEMLGRGYGELTLLRTGLPGSSWAGHSGQPLLGALQEQGRDFWAFSRSTWTRLPRNRASPAAAGRGKSSRRSHLAALAEPHSLFPFKEGGKKGKKGVNRLEQTLLKNWGKKKEKEKKGEKKVLRQLLSASLNFRL